MSTNGVSR